MPKNWAPRTLQQRLPKDAACRSACARVSWRTSSATATNPWASPCMSARSGAMPPPAIFPPRPSSKPSRRPTILHASRQKTNHRACLPTAISPACTPSWTCSTPGTSRQKKRQGLPWNAKLRRWAPHAASPTAKVQAYRRSKAIFSAPTRAGSGAATPARATAFQSRRLPLHRARAATCNATPGTAPCATQPSWPARPS
ncbi:hypothetical protein D9M73_57660 [compost metagenome]